MAKGFIHTVYKDEKWINLVEEGNELGGAHAATREAAIAAGRSRAQKDSTEHVIHNQDGMISDRPKDLMARQEVDLPARSQHSRACPESRV